MVILHPINFLCVSDKGVDKENTDYLFSLRLALSTAQETRTGFASHTDQYFATKQSIIYILFTDHPFVPYCQLRE